MKCNGSGDNTAFRCAIATKFLPGRPFWGVAPVLTVWAIRLRFHVRIRTVKPEFFLHVGLFELESEVKLPVRVAFIGLWCAADREGRFHWQPRKLKAQIMPYDDALDFAAVLDALKSRGYLIQYGDGGIYGWIPSFLKHQCINVREAQSQIPECPADAHARTCKIVTGENLDFHEPRGVNVPSQLAETVLARDGHKCLRCKATSDLTIDHIFPQCVGGTHAISNLRTLCRSCNSKRPVAGIALLDDLKIDGLSFEDMPRMCMHVQARADTCGREGNKEGKGTCVPEHTKSNGSVVQELKARLGEAYHRKPSLFWQHHLERELLELSKRPDVLSELDEILAYRQSVSPQFFPRSIDRLVENWDKTIDESRAEPERAPQRNAI